MDKKKIGTSLDAADLRSVLGASGGRNVVVDQQMEEANGAAGSERLLRSPAAYRSTQLERDQAPPSRPMSAPVRPAPQPVAPRRAQSGSLVDEIERLGDLLARGLITDAEFDQMKKRLLSSF